MSKLGGALAEGFPIFGADFAAAFVRIFMRRSHGNTCPIANGGNQTAGSFCGPHHRIGSRGCQETSLSTIVSKGMAKRRRLRRQISVAGRPLLYRGCGQIRDFRIKKRPRPAFALNVPWLAKRHGGRNCSRG
jgi:hypothetical protein